MYCCTPKALYNHMRGSLFYPVTSVFLSITSLHGAGGDRREPSSEKDFLNKIRDVQTKVKSFAVLCGPQTSPDKQVLMRIGHWKQHKSITFTHTTGSVFLFYRLSTNKAKSCQVLKVGNHLQLWVFVNGLHACYVMEIWPILCFSIWGFVSFVFSRY